MSRLLIALLLGLAISPGAHAQIQKAAELIPVPGVLRNSITNLHAEGDSLWSGPYLNLTADGGASWLLADADSLWGTRNSVYSIDVEGSTIWVGLGFSREQGSGTVPSVGGYLYSTDGGRTFTYRGPHLDSPEDETIQYGSSTLQALPIIVPEQSPPYDIDFDPRTGDVWIAAWASGIRRSSDQGRTWERVVLPPDSLDAIHPDSSYNFTVAPQRGREGHLNHMGFSILVDEMGWIWAGTPRGVNRSMDGGLSWRRFSADGTPTSLTGSWVVSIEEQPSAGRNPVWMATWNAGEVGERGRFGVTVTRDGGDTFEQVLIGEQIHDFAFRGDATVYAAGESGLFISNDNGITWQTIHRFADAENPDAVAKPRVSAFAVAATDDALWVGTSDGLMKSTDEGQTWRVFRTNVPLSPAAPFEDQPAVDTYAYPNPFSPRADRLVRIRYESGGGADRIRIFDFKMNLIRDLTSDGEPGFREAAWDGTTDNGYRVPNGVYFYAVDTGGESVRGKIQVLE